MNITFIETTAFSKEREKYMPDDIFQKFEEYLAVNPEKGDIMVATGGCRKIRCIKRKEISLKRGSFYCWDF